MHGYARIEQDLNDAGDPKILWAGRFDVAERDVVYAAAAFLEAYMPKDDDVEPGDLYLHVWPFPLGEEPEDDEWLYSDAIYTINGNLLVAQPDLTHGDANLYPLVVELLKMGALTSFSSSDQLTRDLTVKTFFYYQIPGWEGSTTGGDREQFHWRMLALKEGWEAAHAVFESQIIRNPSDLDKFLKEN